MLSQMLQSTTETWQLEEVSGVVMMVMLNSAWDYVLQFVSHVQIYAKSSNFYAKLNVTNLDVMNLYQI
jgi:hypothetical protein